MKISASLISLFHFFCYREMIKYLLIFLQIPPCFSLFLLYFLFYLLYFVFHALLFILRRFRKILDYIVAIKFYLLNFISYIYQNLYERKERGRSVKLFMRPNLCDDSVWGGISFSSCFLSLSHVGVKVMLASITLLSFCVTTDELRDRTKSIMFYLSLLRVRKWSRLLPPCNPVLL